MILLYVAVALLYGLAAWLHGSATRRGHPRAGLAVALAAIGLHAFALSRATFTATGLDLSFPQALSLVAWLTALVAVASGLLRKLPGVATVVLPVAAVCAMAPLAVSVPHLYPYETQTWATLHIAVALVAYAFFAVAALQALLLLGLERRVHRGAAPARSDGALPVLTLEALLFQLVAAGFALLTVTLVSGVLFSEQLFGRPLTFTHKNVLSLAGFAAFAVLLWGRWRYGWRGRRALLAVVGGTGLLVMGYLGSKFVSQIVLGR